MIGDIDLGPLRIGKRKRPEYGRTDPAILCHCDGRGAGIGIES